MPPCLSWQWPASCLFLYHYLCMCECTKSSWRHGTHLNCCPSLFISPPFHPQFFTYLTRWVEVNLIIVSWRDEWVCERFHVSRVIKLQMKGMQCCEWETLLKFVLGCQIVFPPLPPTPSLILHWDSLPPVIGMLLKYSSRPVTLTFPFWAHMALLWDRRLVWISEYMGSGGGSWDWRLHNDRISELWCEFLPSYNWIYARYSICAGPCTLANTGRFFSKRMGPLPNAHNGCQSNCGWKQLSVDLRKNCTILSS